jgi:hypothetical protein
VTSVTYDNPEMSLSDAGAQVHVTKRTWTRDWAAWVLIIAPPVMIFCAVILSLSVSVVGAVPDTITSAIFSLTSLGLLAALIVKLVRWLRRRRRRGTRGD